MISTALLLLVTSAASFDTDPKLVRLGETVTASVRFGLPGCEAQGGQPQLAVNVGEFDSLYRVAQDQYAATYKPPPTRFPQVALVAVYCEGPSGAGLEFFRIPLHGATQLPVTTKPGYDVTVEVGDATFGPVKTDKKGQAKVDIFVPPGVQQAVVVGKDPKTGTLTQARVAVDVPPYNRLTIAAITRKLETGSDANTRVEAYYDGAPDTFSASKLIASVSAGSLDLVSEEGGHAVYRYQPPASGNAGSAVIELKVEGDPASSATAAIALSDAPAEPGRFALGGRVGFNHALSEVAGARVALDAWVPFELSGKPLVFSATLGLGGASQDLTTASAGANQSSVTFIPLSLRVGYELQRGHRHWVHAGAGPAVAYARYASSFATRPDLETATNGYGVGATAFASLGVGLGPGHAFAEFSLTYLPINAPSFRVQAGGAFLSLGYRFKLLE